MRNVLLSFVVAAASACLHAAPLAAGDWLTLPSTYTHDPASGIRVNQFAPPQPALAPSVPGFTRSGYTHLRSTIQVGQSQDNYHRVDQWGPTVRPYGEWRYPYRPYSVPYPAWGAPLAGLDLGGRLGGYPYPPRAGHAGGYGGHAGGYGGHAGGYGGHGGGHGGGYGGHGDYGDHGDNGRHRHRGEHGTPPGQPNTPYPTDSDGPYPVAPWYDGYHPGYPHRLPRNDRQFFQPPIQ